MKKYIKIFILIITILYISILSVLFFSQKSMVYFPNDTPFSKCVTFEEGEQKNTKNTYFYEKKGTNNNVILFFHGNAGRACDRAGIKNILEQTNSSIIFVEYHGYADTNNSPNIDKILQDVENIGNYIQQSLYQKIFVFGRSLGTGPAAYYAQNFKTDRLLLVSPYSSLYKIAANQYPIFPIRFLFSENYEPEIYLKNFSSKLLIIHGEKDTIVPFQYGTELYDTVTNGEKELMILPDGNHNNTLIYPGVTKKIVQFFSQ